MATKKRTTRKSKNPFPLAALAPVSTMIALPTYARGVKSVAGDAVRVGRQLVAGNPQAHYPVSKGHIEFTDHGSIERYQRGGVIYRAFTSTPVFQDGYRVGSFEGWAAEMSPEYRRNPRGRRNPESEAADLYEQFHGTPSEEILEVVEDLRVHEHLAGLAQLVCMLIELPDGRRATLDAPDPDGEDAIQLNSSEDGNTIYFRGGDQSIDVKKLGFTDSLTMKGNNSKRLRLKT